MVENQARSLQVIGIREHRGGLAHNLRGYGRAAFYVVIITGKLHTEDGIGNIFDGNIEGKRPNKLPTVEDLA